MKTQNDNNQKTNLENIKNMPDAGCPASLCSENNTLTAENFNSKVSQFKKELETLLNCHSMENGCNTPDFILANYLTNCLAAFDTAVKQRVHWYEQNTCPVCADVRRRLAGHETSEIDGEHGLAAATMRSHEAMLRVTALLVKWKIALNNQSGITTNAMDAGKNLQLRKCIDELESAICPTIAEHAHHNNE